MRTLTVKSHPQHLAQIRQFIRGIAAEAHLDDQTTFNMVLAVDEACANVIRHAYKSDHAQDIIITTELGAEAVEIRLRDFGHRADPATIKSRDLDKVRPGGLGCHFMQQFFDTVEYNTDLPSGTELRLVKKLPPKTA